MGCALSKTQDEHASEQIKLQLVLGEVYVFVPGLRLPKRVDFVAFLRGRCSSNLITRLTSLRSKVATAAEEACKTKPNKTSGDASVHALQSALENYLSALLGMATEESNLSNFVEFGWNNQEDESKETVLPSVYYELLSVLHLLAILSMLEANSALTPKPNAEGHRVRHHDEKVAALDMLLKAAQILDYAVSEVFSKVPEDIRRNFPADLQEGLLKSLQMQALGQVVEIQLGFALEDSKATLAVKRRLACEGVSYWQMACENLQQVQLGNGWGEKHILFLKWKRAASKAAAYYYHGLVLDEGKDANTLSKALACLQAAESFLSESQKFCNDFSAAPPCTKKPSIWGVMKTLAEKIPKEAAHRTRINNINNPKARMTSEKLPTLPDFRLSLQWDAFEPPIVDAVWAQET